ncbi:MAG: hypothetical protein IT165_18975 [Bryobacterales bacterium]|nr:hypothetical protein [Bryobacterales bacterium]
MAARQGTPGLGVLAQNTCGRSEHAQPKLWTLTIGYRYQPSFRHFIGTVEQKQREVNRNQIENIYHLLDFSIERQLTPRWSVSASVPVLFAHRNQLYPPTGKYVVNSFGDATVGARAWIFKPPTESGNNISLGMSLKLPTGTYNATGLAVSQGQQIIATADQSIQAGDGGTGFAVDLQAYKRTYFNSELYFAGVYLFNPRNTNGVSTFRRAKGEEVMSVTDQYLFRGGIGHAVPKIRGLAMSIGGRIEGVPVRDAFGGAAGFRRPGYAISVDPGILYARGSYTFTCNIPVAVERNRKISVTDYQNHTHGDAAFADYTLIFSLSRRF